MIQNSVQNSKSGAPTSTKNKAVGTPQNSKKDANLVAAIDVGSNSVRCLFCGKKQVEITQLSEGLMLSGTLNKEAMLRTAEAIFNYEREVRAAGATEVFVFATEAVRAAKNREEFLELLRTGGVELDLLSSEAEAQIGFLGAYTGGTCAVVDIGGASAELAVGDQNGLIYNHSLPLGAVRLKDYSLVRAEEEAYTKLRVCEYGAVPAFDKLIIIGGTASTFVAIKEAMWVFLPEVVQGYYLTLADIEKITDRLEATPLSERGKIAGLPPKKALVSVPSGVLLAQIIRYLKRDGCIVSERDNLEGYLMLKNYEV